MTRGGGVTGPRAGSTRPAQRVWHPCRDAPNGFRGFRATAVIGRGREDLEWAGERLLRWGIKRASGFDVDSVGGDGGTDTVGGSADDRDGLRVRAGQDCVILARLGPITVREPVRIVEVVERPDLIGFA
ncbi:hypothetical protein GCM10027268_20910 [Brachybacterium huguangmaarense]